MLEAPTIDVTWGGMAEIKSSIYVLIGIENCMKLFLKYLQDFHPVFKAVSVFFDASGKDFGPFYQPFENK